MLLPRKMFSGYLISLNVHRWHPAWNSSGTEEGVVLLSCGWELSYDHHHLAEAFKSWRVSSNNNNSSLLSLGNSITQVRRPLLRHQVVGGSDTCKILVDSTGTTRTVTFVIFLFIMKVSEAKCVDKVSTVSGKQVRWETPKKIIREQFANYLRVKPGITTATAVQTSQQLRGKT